METLENIIAATFVFGSGVLVVFIIARYNYLVKKALVEKGIASAGVKIRYSEIACIVVGIGVGLGVSSVFTIMNLPEDTMDLLVWSVITVGGGVGLFGAHFIRQKAERGE
jgi:hypothetical protein